MSDDKEEKTSPDSDYPESRRLRDFELLKSLITALFTIWDRDPPRNRNLRSNSVSANDPLYEHSGQPRSIELDPRATLGGYNPEALLGRIQMPDNIRSEIANYLAHGLFHEGIRDQLARRLGELFDTYSQTETLKANFLNIQDQFIHELAGRARTYMTPSTRALYIEVSKTIENELQGGQLVIANTLKAARGVQICAVLISLLILISTMIYVCLLAFIEKDDEENTFAILDIGPAVVLVMIVGLCFRGLEEAIRRNRGFHGSGRTRETFPEIAWRTQLPQDVLDSLPNDTSNDLDIHQHLTVEALLSMVRIEEFVTVFKQVPDINIPVREVPDPHEDSDHEDGKDDYKAETESEDDDESRALIASNPVPPGSINLPTEIAIALVQASYPPIMAKYMAAQMRALRQSSAPSHTAATSADIPSAITLPSLGSTAGLTLDIEEDDQDPEQFVVNIRDEEEEKRAVEEAPETPQNPHSELRQRNVGDPGTGSGQSRDQSRRAMNRSRSAMYAIMGVAGDTSSDEDDENKSLINKGQGTEKEKDK